MHVDGADTEAVRERAKMVKYDRTHRKRAFAWLAGNGGITI
jgi:hypothetical protein